MTLLDTLGLGNGWNILLSRSGGMTSTTKNTTIVQIIAAAKTAAQPARDAMMIFDIAGR